MKLSDARKRQNTIVDFNIVSAMSGSVVGVNPNCFFLKKKKNEVSHCTTIIIIIITTVIIIIRLPLRDPVCGSHTVYGKRNNFKL